MKFFHLSDLHIGLKLIERDLREDQEYIFEQIIRLAKEQQPDAMVIAGDIYDKRFRLRRQWRFLTAL